MPLTLHTMMLLVNQLHMLCPEMKHMQHVIRKNEQQNQGVLQHRV